MQNKKVVLLREIAAAAIGSTDPTGVAFNIQLLDLRNRKHELYLVLLLSPLWINRDRCNATDWNVHFEEGNDPAFACLCIRNTVCSTCISRRVTPWFNTENLFCFQLLLVALITLIDLLFVQPKLITTPFCSDGRGSCDTSRIQRVGSAN